MRTGDFISFFDYLPTVPYASRSGNVNGSGVDMLNSDGQAVLMLHGTLSSTAVVTLQESDDDGSTDAYANITSPTTISGQNIVDNHPPLNLAINATDAVYLVHFLRTKRYVRAVITGTGHILGGVIICNKKYTPN